MNTRSVVRVTESNEAVAQCHDHFSASTIRQRVTRPHAGRAELTAIVCLSIWSRVKNTSVGSGCLKSANEKGNAKKTR